MADWTDTDAAVHAAALRAAAPDLSVHPEDLHALPAMPSQPAPEPGGLFSHLPRLAAKDWTGLNTGLEVAFVLGQLGDWRQTQQISRLSRTPYYGGPPLIHEMNPILGPRPSQAAVNIYFPAATLAQYGVANVLPHPLREIWQLGGIGLEAWAIRNNLRQKTPQTPNGIGFNLGFGGHF